MSASASRPRLITRIFDTAHQATVVFLIGSSIFLLGTIGMNIYNRGKLRREKIAQAMLEQAGRQKDGKEDIQNTTF
jgi:hypothetical protein